MNRYQAGALVRVSAAFTDLNGVAIDPSVVKVEIRYPDLTTVTYTYGVGIQIVKDSVGNYHIDLDTTAKAGNWKYEWTSTGTGQAATSGAFAVFDAIP